MPSVRVIITGIAAIASLIVYFVVRGSYPAGSSWPLGICMGVLIGVYILGSLLYGFVQGMREAQSGTRIAPGKGPPPRP